MKKIFIFILVVFISGCAFGPFISQETARTVGNSNHELTGGAGSSGYVFKWNYGLTDHLDLGIHLEVLSVGVRAKYAFINHNEKGWSFAAALGAGDSIGGSHSYADIMTSYLSKSWEPYSTIRVVKVKVDTFEYRSEENNDVLFTIDKSEYQYGQFFLGTRYWINKKWFLSLEGSTFFSTTTGLEFKNTSLVGLATGYRF